MTKPDITSWASFVVLWTHKGLSDCKPRHRQLKVMTRNFYYTT